MPETTGNGLKAKNRERIENAISVAGKRSAMADQLGITDGQLSKLLNGEIKQFCAILQILHLEIFPLGYLQAMERVLREKL